MSTQLLKLKVKLRIEHYSKDGKLKKVVSQEGDRVLDNFAYFLKLIFTNVGANEYADVSGFVSEDGESVTLRLGYDYNCWDYANGVPKRFFVEMGTGTTPPSNSDYSLENYHNRAVASIHSLELLSDSIKITLRGSVSATSDVTINEVGLALYCPDYMGNRYFILLFRDVLAESISLASGEHLSIYYTIEFSR